MAGSRFTDDGLSGSGLGEVLGTKRYHNGSYTNVNSFNRFKNYENLDVDTNGISYVFFTRPNMNINQKFPNNYFNSSEMDEIKNYNFKGGTRFMCAITNMAQSFELTDDVLKTDTYVQTLHGYKLTIGSNYVDSMTEGTFNINYIEDSQLSILKLHKFWVDYIHDVKYGKIRCNPDAISGPNKSGWLDYVSSAYYFKLAPDGHTIKYWAKYTGVFPTNVAYSSQNWTLGDNTVNKPSFSYAFSFKHDMDPWILEDFNYSAGITSGKVQKDSPSLKRNWVDNVCIVKRTSGYDTVPNSYSLEFY